MVIIFLKKKKKSADRRFSNKTFWVISISNVISSICSGNNHQIQEIHVYDDHRMDRKNLVELIEPKTTQNKKKNPKKPDDSYAISTQRN